MPTREEEAQSFFHFFTPLLGLASLAKGRPDGICHDGNDDDTAAIARTIVMEMVEIKMMEIRTDGQGMEKDDRNSVSIMRMIFRSPGECSDSEVTLRQFSNNLIVLDQEEEKVRIRILIKSS